MTMAWLALIGAILFEVGGTLSLRMAATGRRPWYLAVAVGYVTAFGLLAVVLTLGMPLGVAYGIWSASGVVLTAILARLLFDESLTWLMSLGIAVTVGGVLLIETGSVH